MQFINYLQDQNFIEFVLEHEYIPFIVRGSVECEVPLDFGGILIEPPNHHLKNLFEN